MDAKDLRIETAICERNNDGTTKYIHSSNSLSCDKNKSYQVIGSNSLAKVDIPPARPCAVIGPDRVVPPVVANDAYLKKGLEPWPNADNYRRLPEYPHKVTDYQSSTRNISPRQTFQENMQRIMVPTRYNSIKANEDPNYPAPKNFKLNVPSEGKYCDVPYNVNPVNNEQKNVRNTEMCVSNINPALVRSAPQGWPHSSVNVKPSRPYGAPEVYQYTEYPSCAGPRPVQLPRPHRTIHEEPGHIYPDAYYQEGNIRFKPYPNVKERYPQPRFDYLGNYSNPYHPPPPPFPSHKYELQKSLPPLPYATYPQVPFKYVENRIIEPIMDGYQRPLNHPASFNMAFHNQIVHPNYGPVPGNCLQNKVYPYSQDGSVKLASGKIPYDNTNKIHPDFDNSKIKNYQLPESFYVNDATRAHSLKGQVIMPSYSSVNIHAVPSHPYYRKENPTMKGYDYIPNQFRNTDPSYNINNTLSRISSQFSPNSIAISPCDSNASNDTIHTQGTAQEDCGYVSQSSTTSVRSIDSSINRLPSDHYRRYDYRFGSTIVKTPFFPSKLESISNNNIGTKNKKDIDVRQFLQMWSEGDEENGDNTNKDIVIQPVSNDASKYDGVNNQEQLYVLDLVNVPSEELSKYEHIQKISKLPENIKGYNSIELLDQFEEAIGSSNMNNFQTNSSSRISQIPSKNATSQPVEVIPRPISPLDVEAKISQSVIHKEVGCNFEIKPCSPKMLNAEVAAPVQNILGERAIEKIANPHIMKSPGIPHNLEENKKFDAVKHQNVIPINDRKVPSCKMISTPYSIHDTVNSIRNNYSLQDLESNSGVCLASLPRLDNDIELNFPEVNQQFINANKVDSVITLTSSKDLPTLDIEQSNNLLLLKDKDGVNNENTCEDSPKCEFGKDTTKLNKYRKIKKRESASKISENIITNIQSIRTDSVIIKNPETIKSTEEPADFCHKLSADNHDPLNLKLKPHESVNTIEKELVINEIINESFTEEKPNMSTNLNLMSNQILSDNNTTPEIIERDSRSDINMHEEKFENLATDEFQNYEQNCTISNLNKNVTSSNDILSNNDSDRYSNFKDNKETQSDLVNYLLHNSDNIDIKKKDDTGTATFKLSTEITDKMYSQKIKDETTYDTKTTINTGNNDNIESNKVLPKKFNTDTECLKITNNLKTEESSCNLPTIQSNSNLIDIIDTTESTFALSDPQVTVENKYESPGNNTKQTESVTNFKDNNTYAIVEESKNEHSKGCVSLKFSESCSPELHKICEQTILTNENKIMFSEEKLGELDDSLGIRIERESKDINLKNKVTEITHSQENSKNNKVKLQNTTNKNHTILTLFKLEHVHNNVILSSKNSSLFRLNKELYSPTIQNLLMFEEGICNNSSNAKSLLPPINIKFSEPTNICTIHTSEKTKVDGLEQHEICKNKILHVYSDIIEENTSNYNVKNEISVLNYDMSVNTMNTCDTDVENITKEVVLGNIKHGVDNNNQIHSLKNTQEINSHCEIHAHVLENITQDGTKNEDKNKTHSFEDTEDNNCCSEINENYLKDVIQVEDRKNKTRSLKDIPHNNCCSEIHANILDKTIQDENKKNETLSLKDLEYNKCGSQINANVVENIIRNENKKTEILLTKDVQDNNCSEIHVSDLQNIIRLEDENNEILSSKHIQENNCSEIQANVLKNVICEENKTYEISSLKDLQDNNCHSEIHENVSQNIIPDVDKTPLLKDVDDNNCIYEINANVLENIIQNEDNTNEAFSVKDIHDSNYTEIHTKVLENNKIRDENENDKTDSLKSTHDYNCSEIYSNDIAIGIITTGSLTNQYEKCALSSEMGSKEINKSSGIHFTMKDTDKILTVSNEVFSKQRVLKRSLSDTAIHLYEEDSKSESLGNVWSRKRRKVMKPDEIFGPEIITESLCNIIHSNRRNSISSMYNEGNVSFCILIDDDCIITQEGGEGEKICLSEMSNEADTVDDSMIKNVHSKTETDDEHYEFSDTFASEYSEEKNELEESWVDDVACVETVISDDIALDIVISAPSTPKNIDLSNCEELNKDESDIFTGNVSDYMNKVKYIYGEKMCKDDANLVETLYKTPQMNVNKTLIVKESQVTEKFHNCYDKDGLERILSDSCSHESEIDGSNTITQSSYTQFKTTENDKQHLCEKNLKSYSSNTNNFDNLQANHVSKTLLSEAQDDTVHSCESSIDDVFSCTKIEENQKHTSFSSSPEVSSTTSEEKSSSILLKITNYKGSMISNISDVDTKSCNNKLTYKCTEDKDYSYSGTNRPLITKAAQKYIPPLKETLRDLKVKLTLPQHSLIKLKQLKISKQQKGTVNTIKKNCIRKEIPKKPKPKFEDVLKSIDEIQFKMHKDKYKKNKKSIPKVVIKKNENGSHYASTSQNFNPDLTGRKWQPWVFLEKNSFIDKMALKSKTNAIYSYRKNTYVLAEKFYKYKSTNTNFVISQPQSNDLSSGQLKYTIKLKHSY